MSMMAVYCAKCGGPMTPENSKIHPEYFLHDACLPDELKPAETCDLCGDQGPLLLKARCHLTAPLQATLDGDVLILRCYVPECRREVARFKIVREAPGPNISEVRDDYRSYAEHYGIEIEPDEP